ncbi:hypothetical protein LTR20_000039 [Exophiala xenobiotica]|nr:hypothetical protein LTS13_007373 [Exophiala xenobiotica]KAK5401506.1 hypothetical protein LTR79_002025 [Exophiala xenobiotica]KAK5425236.1 hypothetical protein LTR90_000828 [Exophiala xenobiotica]KAK5472581.1 hypothetical protein LTR20_000039 [Exophiala xenobiotica]KAK5501133.1 hypothetical protein LTR26_000826 [Exophiala xenobiotica]
MAVNVVDTSSEDTTRGRLHAVDVATGVSIPTRSPSKANLRNRTRSQTLLTSTEAPETPRPPVDHVEENELEHNPSLESSQYLGSQTFNGGTKAHRAPFLSGTLEIFGQVLDGCLAALTNMLQSPHLNKIILKCLVLALCCAAFGAINGVHKSWGVASTAILRTGSSLGGSLLCSSPIAMGVVQWLGFPCEPPTTKTVHDALNSTAFELGHLGAMSELLIPHCNHFQLATISLSKQQNLLQLSGVDFPNKAAAVTLLSNYSQGLYDSGDEIYKVSLATDRIIRMMISNLAVTEEHLHSILATNPSRLLSWYKTYHVARLLDQLLTTLDSQVLELIETIDQCRQTIGGAHSKGIELGQRMNAGRVFLDKLIGEQGFLFKLWNTKSPLHDMRDKLMTTAYFETETILDMLDDTKTRLSRYRNELSSAKSSMFSANSLSNRSRLQVIVNALHETVTQLSGTSANVELSRKREKDRKAKQWQEGLISL